MQYFIIDSRYSNSRNTFVACEVKSLEQQIAPAYGTFVQEHEHEQELAEAAEEATVPEGLSPSYYKAAIAVLLLLLLPIHRSLAGSELILFTEDASC